MRSGSQELVLGAEPRTVHGVRRQPHEALACRFLEGRANLASSDREGKLRGKQDPEQDGKRGDQPGPTVQIHSPWPPGIPSSSAHFPLFP